MLSKENRVPRFDYKTCKNCGRHASEVGLLSRTRLCSECSHRRLGENVDGIHLHKGPAFDRWRAGMARSVLPPEIAAALIEAGLFDGTLLGDE